MALIGEEDRAYLEERFGQELDREVTLEFFSQGSFFPEKEAQDEEDDYIVEDTLDEANRISRQLYEEVAALHPRIRLVYHDLDTPEGARAGEQARLDGTLLPAMVYRAEGLSGQTRFFGIPSGYEFGSMVETIIDLSKNQTRLSDKTRQTLAELTKPAHIRVFVTPT